MKKFLIALLVICICMSLAACVAHSQQHTNSNSPSNPPSTTQPKPQRIQLTAANASEFFIITSKSHDVEIKDDALGMERGSGSLTISLSPKKRADFDGVTLTLRLIPSHGSWFETECTLEVPFDGRAEKTMGIYSSITDWVASSPSYTVEVESATGYAIVN